MGTRQQNTMNTTTLIILLGLACLVHGSVMVRQSDAVKDETDVADADADLGNGEEEESATDDDKTNEDDKDKEGDKPDGPLPPVFCKAGKLSGKWGLSKTGGECDCNKGWTSKAFNEKDTVWSRPHCHQGACYSRQTSGLKTKKRSRKQKLALLLTILLTAIRRIKTLCHC